MKIKVQSGDISGRMEGKGGGYRGWAFMRSHMGEGKQEALTCTPHTVGPPGHHCSGEPGPECHCNYNRTVCATPLSAPLRSQGLGTSEDGALGGSQ